MASEFSDPVVSSAWNGSLVECVPNFSEGRDEGLVREIVTAMELPDVQLLDWSMDAAHNRSVVTIAGTPEVVAEAAIRGVGRASQLIDLRKQNGEHPRIGAADVVPFVPVKNVTMGEVVKLAHRAGMEMWRRYGVPVYFYEAAAVRPDRVKLEEVRRGQFEGLSEAVRADSRRWPDVGAGGLHTSAGATAVGARKFLIAYNIFLDSGDVATARAIARELRASGGGMHGVKAMGVLVNGRAQVSMNLTDFRLTPVEAVYREVCSLAERHGARTAEGELIGLIPEAACEPNATWLRQIPQFRWDERVLEARLAAPLAWPAVRRTMAA